MTPSALTFQLNVQGAINLAPESARLSRHGSLIARLFAIFQHDGHVVDDASAPTMQCQGPHPDGHACMFCCPPKMTPLSVISTHGAVQAHISLKLSKDIHQRPRLPSTYHPFAFPRPQPLIIQTSSPLPGHAQLRLRQGQRNELFVLCACPTAHN